MTCDRQSLIPFVDMVMISETSQDRRQVSEKEVAKGILPNFRWVPGKWSFALAVLAVLAIAMGLRLYRLTGDYVSTESYAQMATAMHFLTGKGQSYEYYGPLLAAVLLVPALFVHASEVAAQIEVAVWGVLLVALSMWLMWKVSRRRSPAIVFGALIAVNPSLVFASRVVAFENFLLVILAVFLLVAYYGAEEATPRRVPITLALLVALGIAGMALRMPTILVLPLGLVYVGYRHGYTKKDRLIAVARSWAFWGGVGATGLVFVLYLALHPTELAKLLTASRGTFGLVNSIQNWQPVAYFLGSPLLTPATANFSGPSFFEVLGRKPEPFRVIATFLQLPLLAFGVRFLWVRKKAAFAVFILGLMFVLASFYSLYVEFFARYLFPVLYLEILLLVLGLTELVEQSRATSRSFGGLGEAGFYAATIVGVLAAFSVGLTVPELMRWGSEPSRANQMVYVRPVEIDAILVFARQRGVSALITDYAQYVEFRMVASRKDDRSIRVFDLYRLAVKRGISRESANELVSYVRNLKARGEKVWILVGWPTISSNFNPGLEKSFRYFYDRIAETYELTVELRGVPTIYNRVPWWRARNFFVLEVGKESPAGDAGSVVSTLPVSLAGRTRPNLDSDGAQTAEIPLRVSTPAVAAIFVEGELDGRARVRNARADGSVQTLTQTGRSGGRFSRVGWLLPGGKDKLTIESGDATARYSIRLQPLGRVVYDFFKDVSSAKVIAPSQSYVRTVVLSLAGDERRGIYQHPPSRVVFALEVPKGQAVLRFGLGLMQEAWGKSDGVLYLVSVAQGGSEERLFSYVVNPTGVPHHRRWVDFEIDISRFGGRMVHLIFETKPGPVSSSTVDMDWAVWAEPFIFSK